MCQLRPSRYRSLSLSPRRARPPATTRAIQLTHIGIDQSLMMTVPFRKNSHQVEQRNHGKDHPSHQRKCFWSIANQLNRWRTLVGVTTSSSSFVAIRYGSELLNRTSTQVGVSLDIATTAPSSWVTAWRTLSPILMLMPLSFSPSRCA